MINLISTRLAVLACIASIIGTTYAQRFDWMPPQAKDKNLHGQSSKGEQIIPKITETKTPKKTARKRNFRYKYTVDLEKFNISNKGTNPVETANGINAALQYAKSMKKNYIRFPKGTYLISETIPIVIDLKMTIIDLNGSTWKINPSGQRQTAMVKFVQGAEHVRLTNGRLLGDRYEHDYKTNKGSHEGCRLLRFDSGKELEIDHIKIEKAAGFAISSGSQGSSTRQQLLDMIAHHVKLSNLEQGDFTKGGLKKPSTSTTRTVKPYDMTKCRGAFEYGWTEGYQGYPTVKGRVYQAYFYTANMNFISMKKCLQFRKVQLPKDATFMHLVFNQPQVTSDRRHCGRITNFLPPRDVHFHNNHIFDNRCLGFAFCGGQRWLFENNLFEKNGPDVVGWAFDFEDGWELMQDVVMRRNTFKDNLRGDVVICSGSELLLEENTFTSHMAIHGRPHNYTFRRNTFNGGRVTYTTRTGVAKIHNNTYNSCSRVSIKFDTKAVADGLYRKPGETVATPPLTLRFEQFNNVASIQGTYFSFLNCKLENTRMEAGKDTSYLFLKNCRLTNSSLDFKEGKPVLTKITSCTGTLQESGNVSRKKPLP